jgi:hypothetical protein
MSGGEAVCVEGGSSIVTVPQLPHQRFTISLVALDRVLDHHFHVESKAVNLLDSIVDFLGNRRHLVLS